VRQANLAPQLRDERIPDSLDPGEGGDQRSPEELRTMLSSIQKGWLRGRSAADETDGAERPHHAGGRSDGSETAERFDTDQRKDQ
jgi:hypothetical protein